jgi:hypothetical protein
LSQGAVQGPEEFAEGLVIGVRSLFGHTVGLYHLFEYMYMSFFIMLLYNASFMTNKVKFNKKGITFLIISFKRQVLLF